MKDMATVCRMKFGKCPGNPGHSVMMDCDHFYCSSCGDTGHRPCSCADCPDRPENRERRREAEARHEAEVELALLPSSTNGSSADHREDA